MKIKITLFVLICCVSATAFSQENPELEKHWNSVKTALSKRCTKMLALKKELPNLERMDKAAIGYFNSNTIQLAAMLDLHQYDSAYVKRVAVKSADVRKTFMVVFEDIENNRNMDSKIMTFMEELLKIESEVTKAITVYNEKCRELGREDLGFE